MDDTKKFERRVEQAQQRLELRAEYAQQRVDHAQRGIDGIKKIHLEF